MEIFGIGEPQSMSDQPTLQPIDLILVNQAYSSEWRDNTGSKSQTGVTLDLLIKQM